MRNEKSRAFHTVAIGVLLSVVLAAPSPAHVSPGYAHDSRVLTRHPDWMGKLRDDVRLSQLSIPGTHDTMSFYGGDKVQTQTLSLPNQLESGIRVLDIRCRNSHNKFAIYHGAVYQNAYFDDVLTAAMRFLEKHEGETVFMRVMEERAPENSTWTFEETFRIRYWNSLLWGRFFWKPRDRENNPTLSQVRGRIVVLRNFPAGQDFGVDYNTFNIQDYHNVGSNWDLYDKWIKVLNHMRAANAGPQDTKYMNYLSASGSKPGSFPYFIASGHSNPATGAPRLATGRTTPGWRRSWPDFPRVNCFLGICTIAFEGTNVLTFQGMPAYKRVGVIMADFPGPGLIDRTIALNDRLKK